MQDAFASLMTRRVWLVAHDHLHDEYLIAGTQQVAIRPSPRTLYEKVRMMSPEAESALLLASPTRRAQQTAARLIPNAIWESLETLSPQRFGEWEGRTWQDVREQDPARGEAYWNEYSRERAPGGESLQEVSERLEHFLSGLLNRPRWDRCVIVTHPEIVRVLICQILEIRLQQSLKLSIEPLSTTAISHSLLGWQVDGVNLMPQ